MRFGMSMCEGKMSNAEYCLTGLTACCEAWDCAFEVLIWPKSLSTIPGSTVLKLNIYICLLDCHLLKFLSSLLPYPVACPWPIHIRATTNNSLLDAPTVWKQLARVKTGSSQHKMCCLEVLEHKRPFVSVITGPFVPLLFRHLNWKTEEDQRWMWSDYNANLSLFCLYVCLYYVCVLVCVCEWTVCACMT